MPLPTFQDVTAIDPILTNLLVGFKQADSRFVATRCFPAVPVANPTGTFYSLTQKYWMIDSMEERAAGADFGRTGAGIETDTFVTLQWGIEHVLPWETMKASQVPMSLESIGLQLLSQKALIRKERAFAADFITTSIWTTQDNNAATDWDDFASGDPANDIKTGKRGISQLTGMTPNLFVVGEIVDDALSIHPDMIDRIKYVQLANDAGIRAALASIFGVQTYIVAEAIYNTANEGATASYSPIIDDDALLLYVNPSPSMFAPSAGYTFAWDGGGGMGSVARYSEPEKRADILQAFEQWDQKKISANLGAIWLDIV